MTRESLRFWSVPLLAGSVVLCTLGAVVFSREEVAASRAIAADASAPVVRVYFEDRADGALEVLHDPSRQPLFRGEPGTNGFMRSTVRGLVRERKRSSLGAERPFELVLQSGGARLFLVDPMTHRSVDLAAFGAVNAEAFVQTYERGRRLQWQAGPSPAAVASIRVP